MPSANKQKAAGFVVISSPGNRRCAMFQQALQRAGHPEASVVSYADLLTGRIRLAEVVTPGAVVRIESPEKDFAVEKAILGLGAATADEEGEYAAISPQEIEDLEFDKGLILYPRQWYRGFCRVLALVKQQLRECPPHSLMNDPEDIALMFDKRRTHELLTANNIPVPRGLEPLCCYDDLLEKMRQSGCQRVFVKLAHGSSASGVVAYQFSGERHQATTTVELAQTANGLRLYNSRRLFTYRDQRQIATLIDELCRHRTHVERWFPKAAFNNKTFDLRVVVIAGQTQHVVVRLSDNTLTNLHLDNERAGLETLVNILKPQVWEQARQSCEQVLALFPNSLYAGIDLMIASDFKRHAIAEVNAFGDLLLYTQHNNRDTYEAEIEAIA